MKFLIPISVVALWLLSSCIKNNPDPSWIRIEKWILKDNTELDEGELTQNFSDVYVTVDSKIIGFFELPVTLPLLLEGQHEIKLYPVIKNNGISATKKIYPHCQSYTTTVNLVKNETLTLNPETKYYSNSVFWIEDFENSSYQIDDNNSSTSGKFYKENDASILQYGNYYGHIQVTNTDSLWIGKTTPPLSLPKNGTEIYLEIDYMNTNSLLTGVNAITSSGVKDNPNIQLNKQASGQPKWKKIYIELKEIVSYSSNATNFEIYFKAIYDSELLTGDVYIDNIKIVYPQ